MFTCDHRTVTSSTSFPRGSTRAMDTGSTTPGDRPPHGLRVRVRSTPDGPEYRPHSTERLPQTTHHSAAWNGHRNEQQPRPGTAARTASATHSRKGLRVLAGNPSTSTEPALNERSRSSGVSDSPAQRQRRRTVYRTSTDSTGIPRTDRTGFPRPVLRSGHADGSSAGAGSGPPPRTTSHRKQFPEKSLGKSRTEHPPPIRTTPAVGHLRNLRSGHTTRSRGKEHEPTKLTAQRDRITLPHELHGRSPLLDGHPHQGLPRRDSCPCTASPRCVADERNTANNSTGIDVKPTHEEIRLRNNFRSPPRTTTKDMFRTTENTTKLLLFG